MYCVRERKYRGGAAPEKVREHITVARERLARDRGEVAKSAASVEFARNRLDSAFSALQRRFG